MQSLNAPVFPLPRTPVHYFLLPAAFRRIAANILCFDHTELKMPPNIEANRSPKSGATGRPLTEILQTLEKTGADGVGCRSHPVVDQPFMQTLRTARKEVHIWTVDDVSMAKRYLQLGADSLTANRAGWLKQQLRSGTGKPGMPNKEP